MYYLHFNLKSLEFIKMCDVCCLDSYVHFEVSLIIFSLILLACTEVLVTPINLVRVSGRGAGFGGELFA